MLKPIAATRQTETLNDLSGVAVMDIHQPKPIHNWRDFLKEVGTIVLGVCIALAAEQAVETLHNRSRAEKARANVHVEIARNIGLMVERERQEPCVRKRLAEVEGLV